MWEGGNIERTWVNICGNFGILCEKLNVLRVNGCKEVVLYLIHSMKSMKKRQKWSQFM